MKIPSIALLLAAFCTANTSGLTITDFGVVVGKVTSPNPITLRFEDMKITNPPAPFLLSPLDADTSGWSTNGDSLPLTQLTISGFDAPAMSIEMDFDCRLYTGKIAGIPYGTIPCDITSIKHNGSPALFGTPISIDANKLLMTMQGASVDSLGTSLTPGMATGSATGTNVHFVNEPHGNAIMLGGLLCLVGLAAYRSLAAMRFGT